jgi:hypothetical protein
MMNDELVQAPRQHSAFNIQHSTFLILLYALLALIVIPVFPNFPSPNEFTRWLLVAAVVEDHTIEVSNEATLLGPQFEDLAVVEGRVYSNKAPGIALAAAPGYLAARPFAGPPSRQNLRPMVTAMRWFGATLPLIAMAWLFARAARERGASSTAFAVATLLFATPLFAYGLLLFSHALVGAALFAAWVLLYLRDRGGIAAGALIGIAVMSEYPVAIAAAVLVAGLALTKQWKRLALVLAGGAPFAVVLALYQKAAFGGVLVAPYKFEKVTAYRELAQTGIFGINLLSPAVVAKILFHPARGLLLFSPILLACLAAFPYARRVLPRAAFLTLVLTPLAIFLVYGGYPNWHGGWTVGPRYVVSMLPFVVFPLAFAPVRSWSVALFGWSVTAVTLTTLTFPFVPLDFPLPWGSLAMPLLKHGLIAPNMLHWIARPLALAVPLLLVAAAIFSATPRKLAAAAGLAAALLAGYAAMQATARSPLPYIQRAYFEDVYFQRRGILDTLVQAQIASPRLLQRRAAELPFGPVDWGF